MLDLVELMSCLSPGRRRKCAQIGEGAASKFNGLNNGH
jgi:hypothetical protein